MKDAYLSGKVVSDKEIAEASMTVLDDYRCLPEPTMPERVRKFKTSSPDLKAKMREKPWEWKDYWDNSEVVAYYEKCNVIKNLNKRNKKWLEWMKKILPEQELPIRMKLHQFEDVASSMEQPSWS